MFPMSVKVIWPCDAISGINATSSVVVTYGLSTTISVLQFSVVSLVTSIFPSSHRVFLSLHAGQYSENKKKHASTIHDQTLKKTCMQTKTVVVQLTCMSFQMR